MESAVKSVEWVFSWCGLERAMGTDSVSPAKDGVKVSFFFSSLLLVCVFLSSLLELFRPFVLFLFFFFVSLFSLTYLLLLLSLFFLSFHSVPTYAVN